MKTTEAEKKIVTDNKLIAEFMDYPTKLTSSRITDNLAWNKGYHIFWNELMPVVEKIENTFQIGTGDYCRIYISCNNNPKDHFYYCNIFGSEDDQFNGESKISKIDSVYIAVVEFIKWYKNK